MALINYICNNIYQDPYCYISNNIFVTLFLIGVITWILEIRKNDIKKGNRYIIFFCLYQIFSTMICILSKQIIDGYGVFELAGALMGNIIFTEGSILFVFLGVLMYFTKENKKSLATAYILFCTIFFLLASLNNFSIEGLFYENYQWMMIGTLPFMYLYNGKKGKGFKYLFYLFYPVHIVALFWIGNLCF